MYQANIRQYIAQHESRFIDELFDLIRIPSISSKAEHKEDIQLCASKWSEILLKCGADEAKVMDTDGNPVVFGQKIIDYKLPTILIYGHYDVMPVEPLHLWTSSPFDPQIRDGKIYARGADDDKGQSFMHAKAFEYLVSTRQLACNVKFLLEGEEEIGSPSLEKFCESHKTLLACDVILVSDTSMLAEDTPSITTGLRGLAYWQIELTSPSRDLHSGIFGGAVANPINELTKILGGLTDLNGRINIPNFYDDVIDVSKEERDLIAQIPFDEETYTRNLGIRTTSGEQGYSTIERTGIRPSLDICGIWGGYTGEGAKTVLPSKAFAKLSARLVPNQQYDQIAQLVQDHLKKIASPAVEIKVEALHGARSYVCPINSKAYKAAELAYQQTFGKRPLPVRRGGSIGVVPIFESILGVKPILMGFGLESDATHSPDENFPLSLFRKGIETITGFYFEYSKQQ